MPVQNTIPSLVTYLCFDHVDVPVFFIYLLLLLAIIADIKKQKLKKGLTFVMKMFLTHRLLENILAICRGLWTFKHYCSILQSYKRLCKIKCIEIPIFLFLKGYKLGPVAINNLICMIILTKHLAWDYIKILTFYSNALCINPLLQNYINIIFKLVFKWTGTCLNMSGFFFFPPTKIL